MNEEIKVLVADDSSVMRLLISDILNKEKEINVISKVCNGKEAIAETFDNQPDVVVMDMNMGQYGGLYAVEQIMRQKPTPIVMLSAVGNTDLSPIMKAIDLGAIDYLNKPAKSNVRIKDISQDLVKKVKAAANSNLELLVQEDLKKVAAPHTFSSDLDYDVIVIGSSTGGPTAVEKVISRLPENLAVPVLIAQHMPENFIPSFASRLNRLTPLTVEVGKLGTVLQPRHVYVAPGKLNMIVQNKEGQAEIAFTKKKYKEFNYPSVDALMCSVAKVYGSKSIGVILTGMGKDGTSGITEIKKSGGFTVAQSKETSVVFGMPREAINSGNVDRVVAINEIGFFLVSSLN
ncbi:MAG: chemotaxis-specific protein-glutamate methyltransferase CheB [Cyclobacteriaceae bacterium]